MFDIISNTSNPDQRLIKFTSISTKALCLGAALHLPPHQENGIFSLLTMLKRKILIAEHNIKLRRDEHE